MNRRQLHMQRQQPPLLSSQRRQEPPRITWLNSNIMKDLMQYLKELLAPLLGTTGAFLVQLNLLHAVLILAGFHHTPLRALAFASFVTLLNNNSNRHLVANNAHIDNILCFILCYRYAFPSATLSRWSVVDSLFCPWMLAIVVNLYSRHVREWYKNLTSRIKHETLLLRAPGIQYNGININTTRTLVRVGTERNANILLQRQEAFQRRSFHYRCRSRPWYTNVLRRRRQRRQARAGPRACVARPRPSDDDDEQ